MVTGQPITAVAKQTGVSRSWASREVNSPATRLLIDRLMDLHADDVAELVELGLQAIRDCILPVRIIKVPGKKTRHVPNDPRVRLMAAKRVIEISAAGRKATEPAGPVTISWQQFLTIYEQRMAEV